MDYKQQRGSTVLQICIHNAQNTRFNTQRKAVLHVGSILYNTHENTRDVNGTKAHITESVYVHMTGYAAQKLNENINDEWAKNTKLQRKKLSS